MKSGLSLQLQAKIHLPVSRKMWNLPLSFGDKCSSYWEKFLFPLDASLGVPYENLSPGQQHAFYSQLFNDLSTQCTMLKRNSKLLSCYSLTEEAWGLKQLNGCCAVIPAHCFLLGPMPPWIPESRRILPSQSIPPPVKVETFGSEGDTEGCLLFSLGWLTVQRNSLLDINFFKTRIPWRNKML